MTHIFCVSRFRPFPDSRILSRLQATERAAHPVFLKSPSLDQIYNSTHSLLRFSLDLLTVPSVVFIAVVMAVEAVIAVAAFVAIAAVVTVVAVMTNA